MILHTLFFRSNKKLCKDLDLFDFRQITVDDINGFLSLIRTDFTNKAKKPIPTGRAFQSASGHIVPRPVTKLNLAPNGKEGCRQANDCQDCSNDFRLIRIGEFFKKTEPTDFIPPVLPGESKAGWRKHYR